MTQWWNEVSGNYETRLEFFKTANFKEQSDLEGFKGDWVSQSDLVEIQNKIDERKNIGDKGEAVTLVQTAEKVIDAVLRVGSSTGSTYGDSKVSTQYSQTGYPNLKYSVKDDKYLKDLADELSEKAQENRDKILDKLSDWKDKVDDKLDSIMDKMKDQDADTILQNVNASNQYGQSANTVADPFIKNAKDLIAGIRKDQDRDKQFNQAMSMAFERLDRKAMSDKGSPMDLDTRDAITRSVTTAQQILTKVNLAKTVAPKMLNLAFKNLATLKSMCKIQ